MPLFKDQFGPEYASPDDKTFIPKYRAACFCGGVRYKVSADPVDAKICQCRTGSPAFLQQRAGPG